MPTGNEFLSLFAIAFSTGLVAMYIYYRGLKTVPVHVSAILELTWPIIAVIVDYFIFDTVLHWTQYVAVLFLIGSMYMVTRHSKNVLADHQLPRD
jgi:drug/metabolite transporter (DMT)-like permease